jgi:hypothetical protein
LHAFSTPVTTLKRPVFCVFWLVWLQTNTALTSLNLENNGIGAKGAQAIGEGLKVRARLVRVFVSGPRRNILSVFATVLARSRAL